MILRQGNIWSAYNEADLIVFTGNGAVVDSMGERRLVMGAGFALQVVQQYARRYDVHVGEGLAREIMRRGSRLTSHSTNGEDVYEYNFITHPNPDYKLGAFQTKYHYRQRSPLELIHSSVAAMLLWLVEHGDGYSQIHMNYPGIGLGGLYVHQVRPIIECLPDSVHVWRNNGEEE